MPYINSLVDCADIIQKLMPLDCYITITDPEGTILKFVPPKSFQLQVKIGDKVHPAGSIAETLRTGQDVYKILPPEQYGVPVKAISALVTHDGKLEGAIALGMSLETQQTLHGTVANLITIAGQLGSATQELAGSSARLAEDLGGLKAKSEQMLERIQKTEEIAGFVSEIANNSNLLGLNAAIEAARAGEQGRGFAVVAEEIRKMATNSAKAVTDIRTVLMTVNGDTQSIVQTIDRIADAGQEQAAATQEISASVEQLSSMATAVGSVADKL